MDNDGIATRSPFEQEVGLGISYKGLEERHDPINNIFCKNLVLGIAEANVFEVPQGGGISAFGDDKEVDEINFGIYCTLCEGSGIKITIEG